MNESFNERGVGAGLDAPVTWVDIARRLSILEPADELWSTRPKGLDHAQVDWSGATFFVSADEDRMPVLTWLAKLFPNRLRQAAITSLVLDGPPDAEELSIDFEIIGEPSNGYRSSLGSIEGEISFRDDQRPVRTRSMPIIACHSVKGGTGRTTTAIAIATELARRQSGPILIVDADLEAPGLSYLFRASRSEALVSLEDVVALAHAEADPTYPATVAWAASRLAGHRMGELVILPLRRALDELASSSIRAEHLASADSPYAFADLLERIASAAGCNGVVIDVRAGLVPVAAQLVLDPTVARVVVTSLAGQSLEATAALMSFTARELRRIKLDPAPPLLVVNRIPGILRDLGQDEAILAPALEQMISSLLADRLTEAPANMPVLDDALELNPLFVAKLGEVTDLHVPARRWEGFSEQLESSGFLRRLQPQLNTWLDAVLGDKNTAPVEAPQSRENSQTNESRRKALADFAARLVSAETADRPIENPLITSPMRALAMENTQVPIVIVEGAKGTGKTLTARYVLSRRTWDGVAKGVGITSSKTDATLLPVLGSIQTSDTFRQEIDDARARVSAEVGAGAPQSVSNTRAVLREKLSTNLSEKDWTDLWLDAIAWSAGFSPGEGGSGQRLLDNLRASGRRLVCLVEGIEELYDSAKDQHVPPMLRAILIDLPLRLRSEPGRPLGLIVFARRDSVNAGVAQNRSQFRAQYRDFALTWTEADVLELAAWITTESGALTVWDRAFSDLSQPEKERRLIPLWGRKLGPDEQPGQRRVKEAYTAGWVIAALSDLQGRLVARDLVRFLQNAAEGAALSDERDTYGSRLLPPGSLKSAIGPTSKQKVAETEEEIAELANVFAKFRAKINSVRAPIDQEALDELGLDLNDIELLQLHGIILGDSPPYEVPELFRMGLGLRHAGARHSVLGTKRRARQRQKEQS